MLATKVEEAKREEGFTLIELLVVVIIIGILAAIAIPVFLSQRERAWNSAAQSDLRNAAVALESYFTDNGEYDAEALDDPEDGLNEWGFAQSANVVIPEDGIVIPEGGATYCVEAYHENQDADEHTYHIRPGQAVSENGC